MEVTQIAQKNGKILNAPEKYYIHCTYRHKKHDTSINNRSLTFDKIHNHYKYRKQQQTTGSSLSTLLPLQQNNSGIHTVYTRKPTGTLYTNTHHH
jgi:hypothetical protein